MHAYASLRCVLHHYCSNCCRYWYCRATSVDASATITNIAVTHGIWTLFQKQSAFYCTVMPCHTHTEAFHLKAVVHRNTCMIFFENSGGLIGGGCVGLSKKEAQSKNAAGGAVWRTLLQRATAMIQTVGLQGFHCSVSTTTLQHLCTASHITHEEAAYSHDSTNICAVQHFRPTTRNSAASLWPHAVRF